MGIEYRRGGRKVSQRQFFDGIMKDVKEKAMQSLEKKYHGIASSIIDPETNKRPDVIVRRTSDESFQISTTGSPTYARELERRMGLSKDEAQSAPSSTPIIYLAHASEDKHELAEPLAELLISKGIDVWLSDWEIRAGDSIRQKMDQGFEKCSHFIVLLTPKSVEKNWVKTEIDTGFMRAVEGRAKFMGVRIGVPLDGLTELLRSRHCPEIDLSDDKQVAKLIDDIYGLSVKPPLGDKPSHVRVKPAGLEGWSQSAVLLAEYLVNKSETGCKFDPQTSVEECARALGISEDDIAIAILDLEEAGLIETSDTFGPTQFWPQIGLFVEFDSHFLDFDNSKDAISLANELVRSGKDCMNTEELRKVFVDWPLRRFNSALNRLEELRVINAVHLMGGGGENFTLQIIDITDKTKRYVRNNL